MGKKHLDYLFYDPKWEPPEVIYGEDLLQEFTKDIENYAVSTMQIPWNIVKGKISNLPQKVIFLESM